MTAYAAEAPTYAVMSSLKKGISGFQKGKERKESAFVKKKKKAKKGVERKDGGPMGIAYAQGPEFGATPLPPVS